VVKVMAWNILHGGGAARMPRIALALVEHDADVIVLTEFRTHVGGQIRSILADHGWVHQRSSQPGRRQNGVLVASRWRLEDPPDPAPSVFSAGICGRRWVDVFLPELEVGIAGIHVPCEGRDSTRAAFLKGVIEVARRRVKAPFMFVGDFNLGRHYLDEEGATFANTGMLGMLATLGYIDAWRDRRPSGREYSWYSHEGAGFRIDHALVGPALAGALAGAWYSHEERDAGISDHSALLLTLDRRVAIAPEAGAERGRLADSTEKSSGFRDPAT
jgi:exodeoxyribonuclease III